MSAQSMACLSKWRARAMLVQRAMQAEAEADAQARPTFAMERLRKEGSGLVYRCAKQRSEPSSDKADELHLTPLELIDRIATLVPPPRTRLRVHDL